MGKLFYNLQKNVGTYLNKYLLIFFIFIEYLERLDVWYNDTVIFYVGFLVNII